MERSRSTLQALSRARDMTGTGKKSVRSLLADALKEFKEADSPFAKARSAVGVVRLLVVVLNGLIRDHDRLTSVEAFRKASAEKVGAMRAAARFAITYTDKDGNERVIPDLYRVRDDQDAWACAVRKTVPDLGMDPQVSEDARQAAIAVARAFEALASVRERPDDIRPLYRRVAGIRSAIRRIESWRRSAEYKSLTALSLAAGDALDQLVGKKKKLPDKVEDLPPVLVTAIKVVEDNDYLKSL